MSPSRSEMVKMVQAKATELGFDGLILQAIITIESSWIPTAIKYEPGYPYLEDPKKYASMNCIDTPTETVLQQMSWGLGQVMGGNIRWLGYAGSIPDVLQPELGIEMAARYFKKRCEKYSDISDKIASYNAGSPGKVNGDYPKDVRQYVNKVLAVYNNLKQTKN